MKQLLRKRNELINRKFEKLKPLKNIPRFLKFSKFLTKIVMFSIFQLEEISKPWYTSFFFVDHITSWSSHDHLRWKVFIETWNSNWYLQNLIAINRKNVRAMIRWDCYTMFFAIYFYVYIFLINYLVRKIDNWNAGNQFNIRAETYHQLTVEFDVIALEIWDINARSSLVICTWGNKSSSFEVNSSKKFVLSWYFISC